MLRTAAVLLAFLAGPALAQGTIELRPDEGVTIRIDGENVSVVEHGEAEWTPYEVAVARQFIGGDFDHAVGPNSAPLPTGSGLPEPRPVPAGAIRIRFLDLAGRHGLLVIENGYDLALRYRAAISADGRAAPTDVCIVIPRRRGFEHWPYRIERLALTGFTLRAWREGDSVTCE